MTDPRLTELVAAWPTLPERAKDGIIAQLRALLSGLGDGAS